MPGANSRKHRKMCIDLAANFMKLKLFRREGAAPPKKTNTHKLLIVQKYKNSLETSWGNYFLIYQEEKGKNIKIKIDKEHKRVTHT